jgi:uncharacterized integral membrane protein
MPWKLIAFLAILLVITLFIGFNLDNRCDVSFIFYKYSDVPIFVSLLFAYAAGAITAVPFIIGHGRKKAGKLASKGSAKGASKGSARTRYASGVNEYDSLTNSYDPGANSRDSFAKTRGRRKRGSDPALSADYDND